MPHQHVEPPINIDGIDLFERNGVTRLSRHYRREGENRSQLQQFHALLPEQSGVNTQFLGFVAGNILKYAMRTLVKGEPITDWGKMTDFVRAATRYHELLGAKNWEGQGSKQVMALADEGYFEYRTEAAAHVRRNSNLLHIYHLYCTLGIPKTARDRNILFSHINRVSRIQDMVNVLIQHPKLKLPEAGLYNPPFRDFLYEFYYYVVNAIEQVEEVAPMLSEIYKLDIPGYQLFGACDPLQRLRYPGLNRTYSGFLLGNIHKYVYRLGRKDARDKDANKAVHYACLFMQHFTPIRGTDIDSLVMQGGTEIGLPIIDRTAEDYFNMVIQTGDSDADCNQINIQRGIAALKGIKTSDTAEYFILGGESLDRRLS